MKRKLTDKGWLVEEPEKAQEQPQAETPGKDKQTIKELKKALKETEERAAILDVEFARLETFVREKYPDAVLFLPEDIVNEVIMHLTNIQAEEIMPEPTE